jgi:HEPN domain-containing protein
MAELRRGEFLRDRAERFLRNGIELFGREEYDLAAFNLEQSSQLFLKYALWRKLGDFEKIHRISQLLADFREVSEDVRGADTFIEKHKEVIADLEAAYLESRYLPAEFFKEQIERMIGFVKDLKGFAGIA